MRCLFPSFGLLAGISVSVLAQACDPNANYEVKPYDGETTTDPEVSKKLAAYLADNSCFKYSDDTEPNVKDQCKKVCLPGTAFEGAVVASQSCVFGDAPWLDAREGKPLLCGTDKDFNGKKMKTGKCVCNDPIVEFAGNFFIEAVGTTGKILEKYICPLLKALDIVVAVGMAAIPPPGKAVSVGMMAAVRSAKAYKYAYEAQDAAQQWADFFLGGLGFADKAGCPPLIPSKDDLIKKAFGPLSDALDELIPGGMNYDQIQCPPKGCKGCRGPKCRRDDNNKSQDSPASKSNGPASKTDGVASKTNNVASRTNDPAASKTNGVVSRTDNAASKTSNSPAQTTGKSQVATTNPPTTTSPVSTSSSSSSTSTISTRGCKALAALDRKDLTTDIEVPNDDPEEKFRRRSYPINLHIHNFEKRAKPKLTVVCGVVLKSFRYPGSSEWDKKSNKAYSPKKLGFNSRGSCDNYDWSNPDTSPGVSYETEHVLEWQTVGKFFETMNNEITTKFDHPDPTETRKDLEFCEYWKASWEFDEKLQVIDNPIPATSRAIPPATRPNGSPAQGLRIQKRTPLRWIAAQYPFKDRNQGGGEMWLEEFTLLEEALNGRNKARLFKQMPNKDGSKPAIRDQNDMERLIKGESKEEEFKTLTKDEQARVVVQRLREMVGAVKYMQDKDVEKTFANEKNRIGTMIRYLDEELHRTPRELTENGKVRVFAPWKQQDLGDRWNKYMDNVFEIAKKKATDYMTTHLNSLDKEWDSKAKRDEYKIDSKDSKAVKDEKEKKKKIHEDMLAYIKKVGEEWDKVKKWDKPANW